MVVDDDPEMREVITMVLELTGYRVLTAGDGKAALKQVERGMPPRVVFPIAAHTNAARPLAQVADALERARHLVFPPDDSHEVLHHLLQLALNPVRILRAGLRLAAQIRD